jgi:hypothetical protein
MDEATGHAQCFGNLSSGAPMSAQTADYGGIYDGTDFTIFSPWRDIWEV